MLLDPKSLPDAQLAQMLNRVTRLLTEPAPQVMITWLLQVQMDFAAEVARRQSTKDV